MKIQFNNLKDFKNEYINIKKEVLKENKEYKVKLNFKIPVVLHYSSRLKDDKRDINHVVSRLFFTKNGVSNCEYEPETTPDEVYYVPVGMKGGYYLSCDLLNSCEFLIEDKKDYSKRWRAIAESMKKNNINLDIAKAIEEHLNGKEDHIIGFQNYLKKTDRPKIKDFAEVLAGLGDKERVIETMKRLATKSKYGDYLSYKVIKYGTKRDLSVSIMIYPDGKVNYYAASEYAGCGNGDYYVMYSPTKAFYSETD